MGVNQGTGQTCKKCQMARMLFVEHFRLWGNLENKTKTKTGEKSVFFWSFECNINQLLHFPTCLLKFETLWRIRIDNHTVDPRISSQMNFLIEIFLFVLYHWKIYLHQITQKILDTFVRLNEFFEKIFEKVGQVTAILTKNKEEEEKLTNWNNSQWGPYVLWPT